MLLLTATSTQHTFAQRVKWVIKAGGSGNDRGSALIVDNNRTVYIGLLNQTGTSTGINGGCTATGGTGTNDAVYGITDSMGACISCSYFSKGNDEIYAMVKDANGNTCYTGYALGTTQMCGMTSNSVPEAYISKYDSAGNCSWAYRIQTRGTSAGNDIKVDGDGNIYLVGDFQSQATFGGTTINSKGTSDGFVAKYNSAGTLIWVKGIGGYKTDAAFGISNIVNGVFYITGQFDSTAIFGSDTLTKIGGGDVFIAKMDTGGNFLWAKKAGSNIADYGIRVIQDNWGNVFVSGITDSAAVFGGFTSDRKGDFLARYDGSGNVIWLRMLGKVSALKTKADITLYDSTIYFSSCFDANTTIAGYSLTNAGGDDIYIAKLDYNGKPLWIKTYGASSTDRAYGLTCDYSGSVYVTGVVNGTVVFDTDTIVTSGSSDAFILKLAPIYPITSAPATVCKGDTFYVTFKSEVNATAGNIFTVQLSDSTGSFATVDTIGAKADTTAGSIACVVGSNIAAGSHYRVRIVSSNPALVGEEWAREVVIGNIPSAPTAPASQTICRDTAYTFTWDTIIVGTGGDSIEWSLFSNFSYKNTIGSGSSIQHTVAAGNVDTIWLRSKVTATGCVSEDVKTWGKAKKYPDTPIPPAPVALMSDTPVNLIFTNVRAGYGGNKVEWAMDSILTGSLLILSGDSIALNLAPDTFAMIWLRTVDTITGCMSGVVNSIGILDSLQSMEPPDYIYQPVCSGDTAKVAIPNTDIGSLYQLKIDTVTISSAWGNGGTLLLSAAVVDSNTFVNIWKTDTVVSWSEVLDTSIILVTFGEVDTPVFVNALTLLHVNDTTTYFAIAENSFEIKYAIVGGGAAIDSLTGVVRDITAQEFTLRATASGAAGCGVKTKDLLVKVTSIGEPIIPSFYVPPIDTPQSIMVSIDSILAGSGGNQIEWATNESFESSTIVSSPAHIEITLQPEQDTILYIRSRNSETGKVSKKLEEHLLIKFKLLSTGLLDKSGWILDLQGSDEFLYAGIPTDLGNQVIGEKWAFNYCWGNNPNDPNDPDLCAHEHCNNHTIWKNACETQIYNYAAYPSPELNGPDGSGGEVSFASGAGHLVATVLPETETRTCGNEPNATPPTQCRDEHVETSVDHWFTHRSGMLSSRKEFDFKEPGIYELRCRMPVEFGSWPAFWFWSGPLEIDVIDRVFWAQPRSYFPSNIIDNITKVSCVGLTYKRTPCDYTEDWHTFTLITTPVNDIITNTSRIVFFADGKETWSGLIKVGYDMEFPSEMNVIGRIIINLANWGGEFEQADFQIDYFRHYSPAPNNPPSGSPDNEPLFLLNNGLTLENPNVVFNGDNNERMYIPNTTGNATNNIGGTVIKTHGTGLNTRVYYTGAGNDQRLYYTYLANLGGGYKWYIKGLPATYGGAVKDYVTPVNNNLIYYQSVYNRLGYYRYAPGTLMPNQGGWVNDAACVNNNPTLQITNCNGFITVDKMGKVFYRGTDSNLWSWDPQSGGHTKITSNGSVAGSLVVAECGCLAFYRDFSGQLRQLSWGVGGNPVWSAITLPSLSFGGQAVYIANTPQCIALDEQNGRVFFIGADGAVYYYTWNYNNANLTGLVRLQARSVADAFNNNTLCDSYYDAASDISLSHNRELVFYKATDGKLWYYYNDKELSLSATFDPVSRENWNKTPLGYHRNIQGKIAMAAENEGMLFYVGADSKLYVAEWVPADNPVICNTEQSVENTIFVYKTDGSESKADATSQAIPTEKFLEVAVFPNPSENSFTFVVNNADEPMTLQVNDVSGRLVYEKELIEQRTTWHAAHVYAGVYYYKVFAHGSKTCTGKLVKF